MNKLTNDEVKQGWDNAAKSSHFRNFIATHYDKESAFKEIGKSEVEGLIKLLLLHGISLEGKDMVEIGCGAGRMTEFLAPNVKTLYAVDISDEMFKRFKERLGDIPNVKFIKSSNNFNGIADESVDIILSRLVFQHIPEETVEEYLKDGYRILKKGGYFIFQLPFKEEHEVFVHKLEDDATVMMIRWELDEIIDMVKRHNYHFIFIPELSTITSWRDFILRK